MIDVSINRVNISGNLTRDPEFRSTPGGVQVLTFGVAVNDRVRDQQTGEWTDRANFIDVVMFGNRAEALSRILTKGQKVAVEGKLRWSQWQDRETGKNRSRIEVIADEVDFMSSRNGGSGQYAQRGNAQGYSQSQPAQSQGPTFSAPSQQAPANQAPRPVVQTPPSADVYDEDIPF